MSTGFEQSTESRHVMELGEKLASFDIETDTDVSVYPTDTGRHHLCSIVLSMYLDSSDELLIESSSSVYK